MQEDQEKLRRTLVEDGNVKICDQEPIKWKSM